MRGDILSSTLITEKNVLTGYTHNLQSLDTGLEGQSVLRVRKVAISRRTTEGNFSRG